MPVNDELQTLEAPEEAKYELVDPKLRIHAFSAPFEESTIHFQFVFLKDSFFLWIGQRPADMAHLAVAMHPSFVSTTWLLDAQSVYLKHWHRRE